MLEDERDAVASACHQLAEARMVPGTAGNVSARKDDLVAITPTGAVLGRLTADDVTVIDLHGAHVAGGLMPTSEVELHLAIYRSFDTGAVVHTHATCSTTIACVLDELPCIHYQMLMFGGAVPVAPYATFGTTQLAENVVATLQGRSAALMANHGAITHGATMAKAVESMEVLEWASELYLRARSIGAPRLLTDEQIAAVEHALVERNYGSTQPISRRGGGGDV